MEKNTIKQKNAKKKKMINLKDLKLFLLLIFFLTPFNSYADMEKVI